jgi:predicted dehydrogenase
MNGSSMLRACSAVIVGVALSCAHLLGADSAAGPKRIRLAILGLEHGHSNPFIPKARTHPDIELVGIIEPNEEIVAKYVAKYALPPSLIARSLEELLSRTPVDAVATFTTTFAHRAVVDACAPRHIHVMMEKPLAVNMEHARAMAAAAKAGGIHVLVNYETTWSASNHAAYRDAVEAHAVGEIRKLVAHDGHWGPKAPPEFIRWLTDPVLNGGGAIMDFGCYGANLMTWFLGGQRPRSVLAVTQNFQPERYPHVDDEATIVLSYPNTQGIIQASWNWPFPRKDFEVYGQRGSVIAVRPDLLRKRMDVNKPEFEETPTPLKTPWTDSLTHLAAVVRGEIQPSGPPSLENNLIVTEILDAARQSAKTGRSVDLAPR